jgi:DNA-binding NarL/FixJ family response regulator
MTSSKPAERAADTARGDYGPTVASLRVVFADDNYLVREGVAALLAEVDDVDLVQTGAVLTDIRMPPSFSDEGIVAAKQIRSEYPQIGVVVLSQFVEEDYAFDLLADGVEGMGYLLKERVSQLDDLVRALQVVARGGSVLDPKVVEGLLARRAKQERSPLAGLTEREREVLQEMATGSTNAAIARTLFMSDRAVEKHIGAVFQKLGLVDEGKINRRVMATLTFLRATEPNR